MKKLILAVLIISCSYGQSLLPSPIAAGGGGGGGTPGGSDTAIQFNDSSAFGGDATNFSWNDSSVQLNVGDESSIPGYIQGWWGPGAIYLANTSATRNGLSIESVGSATGKGAFTIVDYATAAGSQAVAMQWSAIAEGATVAGTHYGIIGGVTVNPSTNNAILYGYDVNNYVDTSTGIVSYGFFSDVTTTANAGSVTTDVSFWSQARGGLATNAYSFWSDEDGVYRIKSDNTFNSVYQAIPALYNPQFTKYTPGAANYERIAMQWESNVAVITTEAGGTGTLRTLGLGDTGVSIALRPLTTGAASGKHVVCIDTTTKVLYESSTGTDCSN